MSPRPQIFSPIKNILRGGGGPLVVCRDRFHVPVNENDIDNSAMAKGGRGRKKGPAFCFPYWLEGAESLVWVDMARKVRLEYEGGGLSRDQSRKLSELDF